MGVTWFELNHQKFHTLVLFIEGTLKLTKMSNAIKLQCFIMQIGFNETIKIQMVSKKIIFTGHL